MVIRLYDITIYTNYACSRCARYLSIANALAASRAAATLSAPPGTTATTAIIITRPPARPLLLLLLLLLLLVLLLVVVVVVTRGHFASDDATLPDASGPGTPATNYTTAALLTSSGAGERGQGP